MRTTSGSSPHVRGFDRQGANLFCQQRFIPACAGFWFGAPYIVDFVRVHPRMCGVLLASQTFSAAPMGSSPHVRGFDVNGRRDVTQPRFIPACAGFWRYRRHIDDTPKVHPRMCGVLGVDALVMPVSNGSSPHVRGFAGQVAQVPAARRFIPACAGFWMSFARRSKRL